MYLKRYRDVAISKSGVWRILSRLDMGRLPSATSTTIADGSRTRSNCLATASGST